MISMVLIIPSALRDAANTLGNVMGWGPNSYSVPLTTAGTVTHYGLHTWATQGTVDLIEAAQGGYKPPELAAFPDAVFAAIMSNLIMSAQDAMAGHFDAVIAANGLAMVVDEQQ